MYIAIAIKETIHSQANCYIQTKHFRMLHWYLYVINFIYIALFTGLMCFTGIKIR